MQISAQEVGKVFQKNGQKYCKFMRSCVKEQDFPNNNLNEFAFIGASNVGKSSLINALVKDKIAITSNTPGRTRQLNFFLVNERLIFVDMPGFGFAKAQKSEIQSWQNLMFEYFLNRKELKRVFLLIDPIKGFKGHDLDIIDFFNENGIVFQIILTKTDKPKFSQVLQIEQEIIEKGKIWPAFCGEVIKFSAKKNYGIFELQSEIVKINKS